MMTDRRTVLILSISRRTMAQSLSLYHIAKSLGRIKDAEDRIQAIDVENPDSGNANEEEEENDGIVIAKPLSIREAEHCNEESYIEAARTGNANDAKAEDDNTYTAFPEDL
jgi:hypothetical protein